MIIALIYFEITSASKKDAFVLGFLFIFKEIADIM